MVPELMLLALLLLSAAMWMIGSEVAGLPGALVVAGGFVYLFREFIAGLVRAL